MACIGGDVFVQKILASSQGVYVDVDGEGDGSGVGERRERAEPRVFPWLRTRNYKESWDLGAVSECGRRGVRRCTTVAGGDRCLLAPPGSGDQQASPSSSGRSAHPSQRRATVVVRNKGPPPCLRYLHRVSGLYEFQNLTWHYNCDFNCLENRITDEAQSLSERLRLTLAELHDQLQTVQGLCIKLHQIRLSLLFPSSFFSQKQFHPIRNFDLTEPKISDLKSCGIEAKLGMFRKSPDTSQPDLR
ncbi:hypothetical protein DFH08DRAFT_812268 [Mycena albidolilacea]|uniref:Uncharacterized protein n=1 Tax=Mycena albidolilacea TaxID=1033008 RepID=A0AAD7EN44_9AGAR|nr:hypothetical protein DFH08DRAFT_812268 [Mycena albidolilacea]